MVRRQRFGGSVYSGRTDDGPDVQDEPAEAPPGAVGRTGLLADDTDMIRAGIAIMLKDLDYTIVEARSAVDALCLAGDGLHVGAI